MLNTDVYFINQIFMHIPTVHKLYTTNLSYKQNYRKEEGCKKTTSVRMVYFNTYPKM